MDFSKINPNKSVKDIRMDIASEIIHKWMLDIDNRTYINELKAEYLHTKGWSISGKDGTKGNLKHEFNIPQEAFFALPEEIRNNGLELRKWLKKNHPYLIFST